MPENSPLTFTVSAEDSNGLLITNYSGTVVITSSIAATLPSSATLTNGVGTFVITFTTTAGSPATITATGSSMTGTSNIDVTSTGASVDHFAVSTPTSVTAGVPFPVTVTALTSGGATATGYIGTVDFTSLDPLDPSPIGDTTLTGGVGTFLATLKTGYARQFLDHYGHRYANLVPYRHQRRDHGRRRRCHSFQRCRAAEYVHRLRN